MIRAGAICKYIAYTALLPTTPNITHLPILPPHSRAASIIQKTIINNKAMTYTLDREPNTNALPQRNNAPIHASLFSFQYRYPIKVIPINTSTPCPIQSNVSGTISRQVKARWRCRCLLILSSTLSPLPHCSECIGKKPVDFPTGSSFIL